MDVLPGEGKFVLPVHTSETSNSSWSLTAQAASTSSYNPPVTNSLVELVKTVLDMELEEDSDGTEAADELEESEEVDDDREEEEEEDAPSNEKVQ